MSVPQETPVYVFACAQSVFHYNMFLQIPPLAAALAGYVVLNNLSLKMNSIGFYQTSKIGIMPTLILMEMGLFGAFGNIPQSISSGICPASLPWCCACHSDQS